MSIAVSKRRKHRNPRIALPFDGSDGQWITLVQLARRLHVAYTTVLSWCTQSNPPLAWAWRNGWKYTTMAAYHRWLAAQNGVTLTGAGGQGSGAGETQRSE